MYLKNDEKELKIAAAQNTRERDFWLKQLAGKPVKNNFPYDHKESTGRTAEPNIDPVTLTFPGEVVARLMEIGKGDLYTLNLVLVTGIILLMHKYTGDNDITIGTPIYKQAGEGEFINTVLAIRTRVEKEKTFKELLLQVRQTINDAVDNQNYPMEMIAEQLSGGTAENSGFPLFDAAVLLENIHEKEYLRHIHCNTIFSFRKENQHIEGIVEYNSSLYEKTTVENIINHLINLLQSALIDPYSRLQHIEMLTGKEKNQLLYDFNNTRVEYPNKKTILQWFAEQVEKRSHHTAVSSPIDLNDIYDQLDSDTLTPDPEQKMGTPCFKKNPYVYQSLLPLPDKNENAHLIILKTRRHNSVIVNHHVAQLLDVFDGRRNLHVLYHWLKDLTNTMEIPVEFLIYSMRGSDLLEISFEFDNTPAVFSIARVTRNFEDFVQLVKTLYHHHLIELVGMEKKTSILENPINNYFSRDETLKLKDTIRLENLLIKDKEISNARVLLLGDTPGTASTGLLYLGSYLKRNGIKAYCQFYDPAGNNSSMKENIEGLLQKIQPAVAAISLKWFPYIARVMDMAGIIKEYAKKNGLDIKVVVGGNTASYYPGEIIKHDCIDILVRGDGEEPLLKICRGDDIADIPNCLYKNKNGEILENPFTYVQDKTDFSRIYLSHLDEILLSHHAPRLGTFFIVTHKGCAMNCLYCGGCSRAQQKVFNRKQPLKRGVEEVRKDILEAQPYTSTFHFEFDILDKNIPGYCRQIWDGIDLSGHFCIFSTLATPSPALIELVAHTFKYVYWDFDICTPSERHRKQLFSLGLVKPQPSDEEILTFMEQCETYRNIEVRLNLITGLPYFTPGDIEPGEKLLSNIMNTYSCFGELHWARLHAQPGAPIVEDAGKHHMHSYASTFEDFLKYSQENFNPSPHYASVEDLNYPYIYFNDDGLNSRITNFYLETNKRIARHAGDKKRSLIHSDTLTYKQLNEKAGQLARVLKAKGVKPGDIVGLMLERSLDIPVGIFGILNAGCAYMPIDPEFPPPRIQYMLNDSSAKALVTTPAQTGTHLSYLPNTSYPYQVIDLENLDPGNSGDRQNFNSGDTGNSGDRQNFNSGDRQGNSGDRQNFNSGDRQNLTDAINRVPTPPHLHLSPVPVTSFVTSLAYVIYTSGTTGKPKGVLLSRENLVNYVNWFTAAANLTQNDKTALTSSFAFDLGYTSLYTSLLNGGELHILPREIYLLSERLLDYIRQKRISYIKMTPSLFSVIVNSPNFSAKTCKNLRLAAIGGEAINVTDIEKAYNLCSHLKIMNHYGPTEATIGCVATFIDFNQFEAYKEHPVIGKPINNTGIYILGEDLNMLPVGVPGELCISGTCLARGYLNRPELTAGRFIKFSPHSPHSPYSPYSTIYKTGDLARWLSNGTIEFLGRIDTQVKIRGYRIELGEIENRLRKHLQVKDALVIAKKPSRENSDGGSENRDTYLCAYIVPKEIKMSSTSEDAANTEIKNIYQSQTLVTRFQELVKKNPAKIAVKAGSKALTYETLNKYANHYARRILEEYDDHCKLSKNERTRYQRQMLLHGWGMASQEKLKGTTVFVAGAGGGASPTIMQLALAGFGTIIICDFDEVELSNLNRQFLHDETRIGMNKALSAQMTVKRVNPNVNVIPRTEKLTQENVEELVGDAALIFDMFDGLEAKFILSQYAVSRGIPHFISAMTDINAYSAVFHTPHTPCYHCIFDRNKWEEIVSGMERYKDRYEKNPLAVVATSLFMSTAFAVNEAIKIVLGLGTPVYNRFFLFNQRGNEDLAQTPGFRAMTHAFSEHFRNTCQQQGFDWEKGWRGNFLEELTIEPDPDCPVCGKNNEKNTGLGIQKKRKPGRREKQNKQVQTVASLLNPGINMAVAIAGTLEAGKTHIPLDPASNPDRWEHILEDSESRIILTDKLHRETAGKLKNKINRNIKIIEIDELKGSENHGERNITPGKTACILYPQDFNPSIKEFYEVLAKGTEPYIFAYNEGDTGAGSLSSGLRQYLQHQLPDYMIPSHFVKLDKIPLNPNGKVDFKSLPETGSEEKGKERVAPRSETEKKLVEIWSEVLDIEKDTIGIDANFFVLGGHSLNATIMASKIHKELNTRVPLAFIFKNPTIGQLAKHINSSEIDRQINIEPVEEKEYYELSPAQRRLYILQRMDLNSTAYNIPMVTPLKGVMDMKKLEETFQKLLARHESLRTFFIIIEDTPVQKINRTVEFKIQHYDESRGEIGNITKNFVCPFDLSRGPLLRVGVMKTHQSGQVLIVDMHHIVTDGISHVILINEFRSLYNDIKLPALRLQYKDFSQWQNGEKEKENLKRQEEYWLKEFADEIPVLELPTDYPRPVEQSFEGDSINFEIKEKETRDLRVMALSEGSTLFMVLMAVYKILVSKLSGQEDIVIGTPIAGRRQADLEKIIGIFVNTLSLRDYPAGDRRFRNFLEEVKERTLLAFENQEYPFEEIVDKLSVNRDIGRNPLFDIMFILQNMNTSSTGLDKETEIETNQPVQPDSPGEYENIFQTTKFDLTLNAMEIGPGLLLSFQYCTKLFKKETIERFIVYFKNILSKVIKKPNIRIIDIEIVSEEEKKWILNDFNQTEAEYPKDKTIHRLFEEQVEKIPDNTALVGTQVKYSTHMIYMTHISYRQLNEKSNRLAHVLQSKGVSPDTIVGIIMERSVEMVVGILSILKSGGAYLPIDTDYPTDRIDYMLKDGNVGILVTTPKLQVKVKAEVKENLRMPPRLPLQFINLETGLESANEPSLSTLTSTGQVSPANLAYIIYTSGSTGRPKGVTVEHRSAVNTLIYRKNEYRLKPGHKTLQLFSFAFDGFVTGFFTPIISGASVVLVGPGELKLIDKLKEITAKQKVTHFIIVPALYRAIIQSVSSRELSSLKIVTLAGDVLPRELVEITRQKHENLELAHEYGVTEAAVMSTIYRHQEKSTGIAIGKPIANTKIYILNHYLQPQALAVPGELCISGVGLARGYLNRPELTAGKFLLKTPYSPIYRTGDLARWLSDGNIEFLGRIDQQVKLRGFRVELGEIENRLSNIEGIKESVVSVPEESIDDKYICAYFVSDKEYGTSELREYLTRELPDYMIPSYFIKVEKIPLTPNGKVDRKALPKPGLKVSESYIAPRNEIEKKLVELWSEILARDALHASQLQTSLGIDDNFFHLGGHSLKATILVSKLHKVFDVRVPLKEIFKRPRIKELANYIKEKSKENYISIKPVEKKEYYALSSAQQRLYFLRQIDTVGISYNLSNILMLEPGICEKKISGIFKKLIARHESLRTSFEIIAGGVHQRIYGEAKFEIGHYEIEDKTGLEKIIRDFIRPFDLDCVPLLRVSLVNASGAGQPDKQYILLFDMHHIISDGISQGILTREFMRLYAGEELPSLELQYRDYSEWQHRLAVQEVFKAQGDYWMHRFSGEIPLLNLPYDYPRPAKQNFEGSVLMFTLDENQTKALNEIARNRGLTLFMVLLAAYDILLLKLSRQEDIVVGCPLAGRRHADLDQVIGMFVNTLALRNYPLGEKTFAHFLKEVRENTLAAFDNQDYPFEDLVEKIDLPRDLTRNPLFDIGFVVQNIYDTPVWRSNKIGHMEMEGLQEKSPDYISKVSRFDLSLIVFEAREKLNLIFEYCTRLFREETIARFSGYFKKIICSAIENPDVKISEIEILTGKEKNRLLYEFNQITANNPPGKAIHELFEEEAARIGDRIAAVGSGHSALSYRQLNELSRQLAHVIQSKGVGPNIIVGIMVERSVEMIIGILCILRSGGAYLPIDPDYPGDRIQYMLKDSSVRVLMTTPKLQVKVKAEAEENFRTPPRLPLQFINLETRLESTAESSLSTLTSTCRVPPTNPAYIIYTSGSSGWPKGVIVEHRNVVRLVKNTDYIHYSIKDRLLPTGSVAFDITTFEIWGPLLNGVMSSLVPKEIILSAETLKDVLVKHDISILHLIPQLFNRMAAQDIELFAGIRYFLVGGDLVRPQYITMLQKRYSNLKILHMYGPTENTTFSTFLPVDRNYEYNIPIGRPIRNSSAFIIDKYRHLQPTGITGELCVGGEGLTRGYLNQPELTSEKFIRIEVKDEVEEENIPGEPIPNNHMSYMSPMFYIYLTGDLARWLSDGNIEFLGRIDQQVKIRGFRVELGEIENRLSNIEGIKESVVSVHEEVIDDKYICAYFVSDKEYRISELREYLRKGLPDYMIPSYFVRLEKIPLTPNGKVDLKALPGPERTTGESYIAPRDEVETKLAQIWSEVLVIEKEKIGIDTNFFELGGHSLKATILVSKIHKEFDVRIPLTEIFKSPGIQALAAYIKGKSKDIYITIKPVEKKDYYPLSSAQKRLYILQQMQIDGTAYNMPELIPLEMNTDLAKIEDTFKKLIARHETLRTSFCMLHEEPVQRIQQDVPFEIAHHVTPDGAVPVTNSFIRPFELARAPLLRVGLSEPMGVDTKVENRQKLTLLMLDMHHIISDGVSHQVLISDFLALYKGEELLPLRIQYKDFSQWQNGEKEKEKIKLQERYWLKEFPGDIPVLELPTDYRRPVEQSFEGSSVNFHITGEETLGLKTLALKENSTLFMVLTAIFNILMSKLSGREDIVIGTLSAGRRHPDLDKIIGVFLNFLALRNSPTGNRTFREFMGDVKERTLKAFENQDYPYEELVDKLSAGKDRGRNPLFDVMLILQNMDPVSTAQDEDTEIDNSLASQYDSPGEYEDVFQTAKLDLRVTAEERGRLIFFSFEYCTKLFKKETIERFIIYFKKIISITVKEPGISISEIEVISGEEKNRLLYDFNDTETNYPKDKTLHRLFEEQVERTPNHVAVVGVGTRFIASDSRKRSIQITYNQLNQKSHQLAIWLKQKGVGPDTIAAVMMERSIDMMISIFGILKAGCAYLPIDANYPEERVEYILADSAVKIVLTSDAMNRVPTPHLLFFHPSNLPSLSSSTLTSTSTCRVSPANLAYIIYTSGSTGKPKGVMIEHRSVINRLNWMQRFYPLGEKDVILQKTTYVFDVSVWELFWWSFYGASVCLLAPGDEKSPRAIIDAIEKNKITTIHFVPSMLNAFLEHREDSGSVNPNKFAGLMRVFSSGEALGAHQAVKFHKLLNNNNRKNETKLINLYGPTEATVDVSYFYCSPEEKFENISIPIGKPIDNICLYIVNKNMTLQPVGVVGELCIAGVGLARGYLNKPGLTAEKFDQDLWRRKVPGKRIHRSYQSHMSYRLKGTGKNHENHENHGQSCNHAAMQLSPHHFPHYPITPIPHHPIYLTGDLAKWLPDGNIEFIGRIDHQVKIRGFRIELGEIENQLLARDDIKKTIVVPGIDANGDKYLCAYIVLNGLEGTALEKRPYIAELRKYLSAALPGYMIPSYFMILEKLPVTLQGKVDRRSLPTPELKTGDEYTAPQNEMEKKMVETWSKALALRKEIISTDNNFIELGGNSLKALTLISYIHKAFNVQLYLKDIFEAKTIKELARLVSSSEKNMYSAIDVVEKQDHYPASSAQKRLFIINMIEGENATNYNLPQAISIKGKPDKLHLAETFNRLIQHHESLRTSFAMPENTPVQIIHDKVEFKIGYSDSSEEKISEKIQEFIKPFDLSRAPLMRAELVKIDEDKHILMFDMHHIIADGAAYMIMEKDFMLLYTRKTLPTMRIQYKDFTFWQNNLAASKTMMRQEEYWLNKFKGPIPLLELPTDFPRPEILCTEGRTFYFEVDSELTAKIKRFNLETGTTIYMVLLAAYTILLSKYSLQEEIIVGTPITGRNHADLQNVIGTFANMLALKNCPQKNKSFIDFLREVKENIHNAFENQDYQFEELVTKLGLQIDPARNPLFDVVLNMADFDLQDENQEEEEVEVNDGSEIGQHDIEYTSSKYDLLLRAREVMDTVYMALEYSVALFKLSTIEIIAGHFIEILNQVVENKELKIKDIAISSSDFLLVESPAKREEIGFNF